jgi:hypothetical protein
MKLPKQTANVDRNLGLAGAVGVGNVHASIDWGSVLKTAGNVASQVLPIVLGAL